MADQSRGDRSEFNPDPAMENYLKLDWELVQGHGINRAGSLKTKLGDNTLWVDDLFEAFLIEVGFAIRRQLGKKP